MDVIYVGQEIDINWSIRRNASEVLEDFSKADLKVFLTGNDFDGNYDGKYYFANIIDEQGRVKLVIEAGSLTSGTYCIEGIWIKNSHELLNSGWTRSISRARKDRIFKVSDVEEECTDYNETEGHVVEASHEINIATGTTSYGYDGMSAYETAVFNGSTAKTEKEWIDTYEKAEERVNYEMDPDNDGEKQGDHESWAHKVDVKWKEQIDDWSERAQADHERAGEDSQQAATDHNRANTDHTRANEDSGRASNDHTQAVSDSSRAGEDHTQAVSDSSRAGEDHTQAVSDSSRAGEDHTQAVSDSSRAGEDHTQAVSDSEQAATDHNRANEDSGRASNDHTQAVSDSERAAADHAARQEDVAAANQAAANADAARAALVGSTGAVNVNLVTEHEEAYSDAATARGAVLAAVKEPGLKITYLLADGWHSDQFIGDDIDDWSDASKWQATGPVSVSQNTLTIGGEDKGELAGQLIENPEWVWVIADSNNHVIAGIRSDTSVDWIKGVPRPVKDYIDNLLRILFADVSNIEDFIGTLIEGQKTLQQLLDEKVNKVPGKSLLDKEYADCLSSALNIEWPYLIKDANNKIILGIKNNLVLFYAGVLHTEKGLEIGDYSVNKAVSEEYVEIVLGINGKIIAATYVDGSHYVHNLKSETIDALIDEINQKSVTAITLTNYENLIEKGERTPYMLVEEGPNGQCIKVFVGDKEINVTSRYNVENTLVRAYLHSFLYDNNDYSYTKITDYYNLPFSTERSYPFPAYVSIDKGSVEPSIVAKTIVETYLEDTLFRTDEFDGLINNIPVFNLIPGKEYQFKVKYQTTDGYIYPYSVGTLTIIGQERMIYIDGMYNFRDIGGWPTVDGKTIKYDMLFRSAELQRGQQGSITAAGINELLNNIKIDVELDFGDESSSSPIEDYVEFLHGSDYQIRAYDDGLNPNSEGYRGTQYKNCFNAILNRLRNGDKILFHCNAGCDRTGTFAFILEGLLGVSESDLSKDYELSSMAWLRTRVAETGVDNYASMVSYIKSNFTGDTLNDKITNMMISFGVLSADITEFKSLMLN